MCSRHLSLQVGIGQWSLSWFIFRVNPDRSWQAAKKSKSMQWISLNSTTNQRRLWKTTFVFNHLLLLREATSTKNWLFHNWSMLLLRVTVGFYLRVLAAGFWLCDSSHLFYWPTYSSQLHGTEHSVESLAAPLYANQVLPRTPHHHQWKPQWKSYPC